MWYDIKIGRVKIMKRKKKSQLIVICITVVLVIGLLIGGFFVFRALTALKSIQISPDFAEQELDIDTDYTFTVVTDPANASLKNAEYVADNGYATITVSETEKGKFTLHTMAEGTITVVVRDWDTETESNSLTFEVVDQARIAAEEAEAQAKAEAEAAAAAEAQAQAEAEAAAAAAKKLVMTTDKVKVRKDPSTDGEVVSLVDIGEVFTKIEDVEDAWTKIEYEGGEAYIKSDYLQEVTEEEAAQAKEEAEAKAKEEEEKAKEEEKKKEETKKEETPATAPAATTDASAAQAATDATAKKAADDAAALVAAQQAAAVAAAATGHPFTDKNGQSTTFTAAEWDKLVSIWAYTGQAEEMISHHTCGELRTALSMY